MWAVEGRAGEEGLLKPFGAQKIMSESQMLDNELQDLIYVVRCWFCFYLIVGSLIIPLWNKKVRNLLFILQEPTVNNHS